MVDQILQTKLVIPQIRDATVIRPRLLEKLDQGYKGKITILSAPVGFGKTTLLVNWLQTRKIKTAWLSIDRQDNDPIRFLSYWIASAQSVFPQTGHATRQHLSITPRLTLESLISMWINELSQIQEPLALVLDDYHLIQNRDIHDSIQFFLEHQPQLMHLFFTSRADLPIPLSRLRAQGQLQEIIEKDLRFNASEAESFFQISMQLDLDAKQIEKLTARTEGWIAGLQMSAIAINKIPLESTPFHRDQFIDNFSGSNRFILDYLIEEVFNHLSDEQKTFLLYCSILDRLTAPLCDAIIKNNAVLIQDSQTMLENMETNNLFISALDEERRWFRFHKLFRDLMLKILNDKHPDIIPDLHLSASKWLQENGYTEEAYLHAIEAQAFPSAAKLLETMAEGMLMRSELTGFLSECNKIPEPVLKDHPSLIAFQAIANLIRANQITEIEKILQSDQPLALSDQSQVVRAMLALIKGQYDQASALAFSALENLPSKEKFFYSMMTWLQGVYDLIRLDLPERRKKLWDILEQGTYRDNYLIQTIGYRTLADVEIGSGDLEAAKTSYEKALELTKDPLGNMIPIAGELFFGLGSVYIQWNMLDIAEDYYLKGIEYSLNSRPVATIEGYCKLAYLNLVNKNESQTAYYLSKAKEIAHSTNDFPADDIYVAFHQARLNMLSGRYDQVENWISSRQLLNDLIEYPDLASMDFAKRIRKYELLVLTSYLIKRKKVDQSLIDFLLFLREEIQKYGKISMLIEIDLNLALAYQQTGNEKLALSSIGTSIRNAYLGKYLRPFLDEGEPALDIILKLNKKVNDLDLKNYIQRIISAFNEAGIKYQRDELAATVNQLVESFTERELEILQLLASSHNTSEIAANLFIAPSTVRSHIKSIYQKLDVHRRWDAINKAREAGILS